MSERSTSELRPAASYLQRFLVQSKIYQNHKGVLTTIGRYNLNKDLYVNQQTLRIVIVIIIIIIIIIS